MVSTLRPGIVWIADDCGDVVCRPRDRSRRAARFRVLECRCNCQLPRPDRLLTRGEFRCCRHDDGNLVARVFPPARVAGHAKQTSPFGWVLRVCRFLVAGERACRDRAPVRRRGFLLLAATRVAVAFGLAEFGLGCAARACCLSYLVWTSHRAARLELCR